MGRPFKEPWLTPEERAAKAKARAAETQRARNARRPRKFRHNGPEFSKVARWEAKLLRVYGITLEDYAWMMYHGGWACACCKQPFVDEPLHNREPVVDHCHATSEVRGLLCRHCNMGIGLLGDNLEAAQAAVRYLQETCHVQK